MSSPCISQTHLRQHRLCQNYHFKCTMKRELLRINPSGSYSHNLSIIHFLHQQKYREKYKMKKILDDFVLIDSLTDH
jgi:hypothetical protein